MADPASIIGLVAIAAHSVNKTWEFIQAIQEAPNVVKSLAKDLSAIKAPLKDLGELCEDARRLNQFAKTGVAQSLGAALLNCQETVSKLRECLRPYVKSDSGVDHSWKKRTAFTFKGHEISGLRSQLEACKNSLILAGNCASMQVQLFETLLSQRTNIDRAMQSSHKQQTDKVARGMRRLQHHFDIETSTMAGTECLSIYEDPTVQQSVTKWLGSNASIIEGEDASRSNQTGCRTSPNEQCEVSPQAYHPDCRYVQRARLAQDSDYEPQAWLQRLSNASTSDVNLKNFSRSGSTASVNVIDQSQTAWDEATGRGRNMADDHMTVGAHDEVSQVAPASPPHPGLTRRESFWPGPVNASERTVPALPERWKKSHAEFETRWIQGFAKKFRESLLPECVVFLQTPPMAIEAREEGRRLLHDFLNAKIIGWLEQRDDTGVVGAEITRDALIQNANVILKKLEAMPMGNATIAQVEASQRWWPGRTAREKNKLMMKRLEAAFWKYREHSAWLPTEY